MPAPWSPSVSRQHPPLSWSPLRLFAQAVALKAARSVWMFFSQAELLATCLLSLHFQRPHSPQAPRRKAARYIWKYVGYGGQCYFETKCQFWYVQAGEGCPGAFIYLLFFFLEGACIPDKSRSTVDLPTNFHLFKYSQGTLSSLTSALFTSWHLWCFYSPSNSMSTPQMKSGIQS